MAVTISLYLFGKPAQELNKEGEEISGADVRALAEELHARLTAAADAIDRLTAAGWEAQMTLYDVMLSHPYVETEADARGKVEDLGLNPDDFFFLEFEDEEGLDEGELEGGDGEEPAV